MTQSKKASINNTAETRKSIVSTPLFGEMYDQLFGKYETNGQAPRAVMRIPTTVFLAN